jgi:glutaredoxin
MVEEGIKANKVFVISKVSCPYCVKALAALRALTDKVTVIQARGPPLSVVLRRLGRPDAARPVCCSLCARRS